MRRPEFTVVEKKKVIKKEKVKTDPEEIRQFPGNYKTVLCKRFERSNFCEYGKECTYAHG